MLEVTKYVVAFNASFDIPLIQKLGHTVHSWEDSMLAAYSCGIVGSLEDISRDVLHAPYTSVRKQWKKSDQGNIGIDHIVMAGWSIQHALNALKLWNMMPKVALYKTIDRPFIDILIEMEQNGILIDQYMLTQVEQDAVSHASKLEKEITEELGMDINLASNPQVAAALQLKGILGTRKTKGGADSVSDESLAPLHNPTADKILKHRSLMKTVSTYIPAFRNVDKEGKIHTNYGYTNTGRLNSSKPNLQNITRDEAFEDSNA
jgi:DNA polymerase I-like protein with 3'-5' exonuclease and polymerase domains